MGNVLISGRFVSCKITEYEVGWTCSMQETDNKCVQFIRKKLLTYEINWNTYTWKSIILKLILNKQVEKIGFDSCVRRGTSSKLFWKKILGNSWLLQRLICYQKLPRSMHWVIDMRYQTSISWNAVWRNLIAGYWIEKQPICPIFQGSSSSTLAIPKRRYTNTTLSRTTKSRPINVGAPGRLNIRRPFKPIFFFGLGHDWRKVQRTRAQIVGCFRINDFACGNLSLPAPYFRLQSCTAYRLFDRRRIAYTIVVS